MAALSDAGSIYRSPNLGQTWARFDDDVSIGSTLMIIAPSVTSPDRVYGAARRGEILGTNDGDESWRKYPLPAEVRGVYALAATEPPSQRSHDRPDRPRGAPRSSASQLAHG